MTPHGQPTSRILHNRTSRAHNDCVRDTAEDKRVRVGLNVRQGRWRAHADDSHSPAAEGEEARGRSLLQETTSAASAAGGASWLRPQSCSFQRGHHGWLAWRIESAEKGVDSASTRAPAENSMRNGRGAWWAVLQKRRLQQVNNSPVHRPTGPVVSESGRAQR